VIPQDQLDRLDEIIRRARAAGDAEVLARAVDLLGQVLRQNAGEAAGTRTAPDPMSRAHAREDDAPAEGLHQLRKGRDRCGAARRDGGPCRAPAIPGGLVCRRHGGAAPQVAIRAKHMELLLARYVAHCDWQAARGTPGEFDALCRALQAGREVSGYEAKMRLLAELKAERKRRQAVGSVGPYEALKPTPRKDRAG
jgi:hypothetical protein